MQEQNKLELRTRPTSSVHVKKMVVITIIAVVVLILLLAIVAAFDQGGKRDRKVSSIKAPAEQRFELSPMLQGLPNGYNDVNGVQKYTSGMQSGVLNTMQQQLAQLRSEHEILEQELLKFSKRNSAVTQHVPDDAQTQQAKSSSLVFSSVAGGVENLLTQGMSQRPEGITSFGGAAGQSDIAPTKQQEAFFAQQARDTQKMAVMKAKDNPEDIYDLHNVVTPVSPYEIQAGTVIPAVLITGVNTSVAGSVVAQVRQTLFDTVTGKFVLIPKGSKLLGEYDSRVSTGQRRILIAFNRIIRPDGSSILLGKPNAADLYGQAGMEGDVDNHWLRILSAATISTILSVGAGVASDHYDNNNNNNYPNSRQRAILGGSEGISQTGQKITDRAMDIQPTITLPAGYQFNVIVKKDMVIAPYKNSNL